MLSPIILPPTTEGNAHFLADMMELDLAIVLCSQDSLELLQQDVCQVDSISPQHEEPVDDEQMPGSPPKAASKVCLHCTHSVRCCPLVCSRCTVHCTGYALYRR